MGEDGRTDLTGRPVLGTLLDPTGDRQARELSFALASDADAPVRFLSPQRAPEGSGNLVQGASSGETVQIARTAESGSVGRSPAELVAADATSVGADVVALQRQASESSGVGIRRATTDRIVATAPTDVAIANGRGDLKSLASILVPVAGGPHTELAVRVARALARHTGAWVELFHVVPDGASADTRSCGADCLASARTGLEDFENFDTWLFEADDPATAIAEQSRYYDAVVMGAPTKGRLRRLVFGSTLDAVDERVEVPVVTAVSSR